MANTAENRVFRTSRRVTVSAAKHSADPGIAVRAEPHPGAPTERLARPDRRVRPDRWIPTESFLPPRVPGRQQSGDVWLAGWILAAMLTPCILYVLWSWICHH